VIARAAIPALNPSESLTAPAPGAPDGRACARSDTTARQRPSGGCLARSARPRWRYVPPGRVRSGLHPDPCGQTSCRSRLGTIKHDGYRLQVRRAGTLVRLFTRYGFDWSVRYFAISAASAKLAAQSFTLDGEAVVCGRDGAAIFKGIHRQGDSEAMLYAFDLLELDGDDLRGAAAARPEEAAGEARRQASSSASIPTRMASPSSVGDEFGQHNPQRCTESNQNYGARERFNVEPRRREVCESFGRRNPRADDVSGRLLWWPPIARPKRS
jgi:hypothetical protein